MTIKFTDQEWNNIEKNLFAWRVSENCPDAIRKTLEPKLKLLQQKDNDILTLTGKPISKR